jgi:hypothetical protein
MAPLLTRAQGVLYRQHAEGKARAARARYLSACRIRTTCPCTFRLLPLLAGLGWGDMKSPSGRGVETSGIFKWAGVVVLISRGACLTSLPRTWLSTRQPPEEPGSASHGRSLAPGASWAGRHVPQNTRSCTRSTY